MNYCCLDIHLSRSNSRRAILVIGISFFLSLPLTTAASADERAGSAPAADPNALSGAWMIVKDSYQAAGGAFVEFRADALTLTTPDGIVTAAVKININSAEVPPQIGWVSGSL